MAATHSGPADVENIDSEAQPGAFFTFNSRQLPGDAAVEDGLRSVDAEGGGDSQSSSAENLAPGGSAPELFQSSFVADPEAAPLPADTALRTGQPSPESSPPRLGFTVDVHATALAAMTIPVTAPSAMRNSRGAQFALEPRGGYVYVRLLRVTGLSAWSRKPSPSSSPSCFCQGEHEEGPQATLQPGLSSLCCWAPGYVGVSTTEPGAKIDSSSGCWFASVTGCSSATSSWSPPRLEGTPSSFLGEGGSCSSISCYPPCHPKCKKPLPSRCTITAAAKSLEKSATSKSFEWPRSKSSNKRLRVPDEAETEEIDSVELQEELLLRSLSICGRERVFLLLEDSANGTLVAEGSIPMRSGLPDFLVDEGIDMVTQAWAQATSGSRLIAEPMSWPRRHRLQLRKLDPARAAQSWLNCSSSIGGGGSSSSSCCNASWLLSGAGAGQSLSSAAAAAAAASMPSDVGALGHVFLEVEMLVLADDSLPRMRGTHPLKMAVDNELLELVRAFMMFDILTSADQPEQWACLSTAIEKRNLALLSMLLEQIPPRHHHLLEAIATGVPALVEVILEAGGAPVLNPRSMSFVQGYRRGRMRSGQSPSASPGRTPGANSSPFASPLSSHRSASSPVVRGLLAASAATPDGTALMPSRPAMTPLAVAASRGHAAIVEAMCSWARRERIQVDPSAPAMLSEVSSVAGRQEDRTTSTNLISPWQEREYLIVDGERYAFYGDPPLVMAIRCPAPLPVKLRMIRTFSAYGFTPDAKSCEDSWTPLLAAVELGELEVVQQLIEMGAKLFAEQHSGFTPLHLACQAGHWHLLPALSKAMQRQYDRVAEWGPSPQYVTLNLADAYGRTPLDIALQRYFAHPLVAGLDEPISCITKPPPPPSSQAATMTSGPSAPEGVYKAVDLLRESIYRTWTSKKTVSDADSQCDMLKVLRLMDAVPDKASAGQQLWPIDCDSHAQSHVSRPMSSPSSSPVVGGPEDDLKYMHLRPPPSASLQEVQELRADLRHLLEGIRILIRAGAQPRLLAQVFPGAS